MEYSANKTQQLDAAPKKLAKPVAMMSRSKLTCKEVNALEQLPEARLGHSPIKNFGYSVYLQDMEEIIPDSRASSNVVNGFIVFIKVG